MPIFSSLELRHLPSRCAAGVRFDSAAESYAIVAGATGTTLNCSAATPIPNPLDGQSYTTQFGVGRASELAGVAIDGYALDGDACLGFGKYGQTDQASTATVTLRCGAKTLTLSIDPMTGEATIP